MQWAMKISDGSAIRDLELSVGSPVRLEKAGPQAVNVALQFITIIIEKVNTQPKKMCALYWLLRIRCSSL